jgi:hypothetical protein
MTENFQLVLELISYFGNFADHGGVNFSVCFGYLASLVRGQIPQKLDETKNVKFFLLFYQFEVETLAGRNFNFPELTNK